MTSPFRMPGEPLVFKARKKRKARRCPAAPEASSRLYVEIEPAKVGLFRFLLEAEDNLALMTVVDRWRAVLLIRFSPQQEQDVRNFLNGMSASLPFTILNFRGPGPLSD